MAFDASIFVSLAFLFGIAAHFRAADGNSFLRRMLRSLEGRTGVMYGVVVVTSVFSPFILNDVLILILTPVLVGYAKETGADIAPLLVAEVVFTNIASCLTPIGNPQNILLWQASGISASSFVAGTWLPVVASGAIAAAALFKFRGKASSPKVEVVAWSWRPAAYLAGTAAIVFVLNVLGVSSLVSLGLAFALGFVVNARSLVRLALEFDVRSLLTLYVLVGAIVVVAAFVGPEISPYVVPVASGKEPYAAEFFAVVSAAISNVPATQLVLSTSTVAPHAAPLLAVDAGLAGNIDPISSFANLLALLMVRRSGIAVKRAVALQLAIGLLAFIPALL